MIEISHLNYLYPNSNNGIKDINFTIEAGDMVALVGKNGSGKTTFLNLLTGITKPQSGTIKVGADFSFNDISYCLQMQSIDWYLNVEQNITLPLVLNHQKEHKLELILDLLGLKKYRKKEVDTLSGGEQQRVQVARALVKDAKLYALDEPTVALDVKYADVLMRYLKEESQKNKMVIVSSHDLLLLETYCNKIIYFVDGKVQFFGTMNAFLQTYQQNIKKKITLTLDKKLEGTLHLAQTCEVNGNEVVIELAEEENLNHLLQILMEAGYKIEGITSEILNLTDILLGENS